MLCCKNHNNHENDSEQSNTEKCEKHRKNHKFHMLIMILCCTIPILLFIFLPIIGIYNDSFLSILSYLMILLCPLAHIFMMKELFKKE